MERRKKVNKTEGQNVERKNIIFFRTQTKEHKIFEALEDILFDMLEEC